MTILYSVLHFLVDGICAFAMMNYFSGMYDYQMEGLLYNFCAFALQMPLGVILDIINVAKKESPLPSFWFAFLGVAVTYVGAFTHPVILGIGNALFHLGGGVGTIQEDRRKNHKGTDLGIFVAPGALGLFLGTLFTDKNTHLWVFIISLSVVLICFITGIALLRSLKAGKSVSVLKTPEFKWKNGLVAGCFLGVILRSYLGLAISFSWKTTVLFSLIAVLAVVLGKIAGGFAAAYLGVRRTVLFSLAGAAVCYLFSGFMPLGILALFLFNMTMPITLYGLVQRWEKMPGLAFGLLTFAIFIGYIPVYLGLPTLQNGNVLGFVGSVLSGVILIMCLRKKEEV